MAILIFVISAASLAVLLARGDIFHEVKEYIIFKSPKRIEEGVATFMFCPTCIGFWTGLFISFFMDTGITTYFVGFDHLLAASVIAIAATAIDIIVIRKTVK